MNSFWGWIGLTAILGVIGLLVANCLYKRTNHYKNKIWQEAHFAHVPEEIEITAIGSGPGLYDLDLEMSERKGFSFCQAPQSFEYGYKLLRHYQKRLKTHCIIIIIIICPLHFAKNKNHLRTDYYYPYYDILQKEEIRYYSKFQDILRRFPVFKHPKYIFRIFRDVQLKENLQSEKALDEEEAKKSFQDLKAGWLQQTQLKDLEDASQATEHREAFQKAQGWLQKVVDLCEEKKWRPVFVIPPMESEVAKHVSAEFKEEFVMRQIRCVNKKGYPMLDYFDDMYFSQRKFYQYSAFMNRYGRQEFTEKVLNDIDCIFQ